MHPTELQTVDGDALKCKTKPLDSPDAKELKRHSTLPRCITSAATFHSNTERIAFGEAVVIV